MERIERSYWTEIREIRGCSHCLGKVVTADHCERVREFTGGFGAHSVLECVGLEQSMLTALDVEPKMDFLRADQRFMKLREKLFLSSRGYKKCGRFLTSWSIVVERAISLLFT